MVGQKIKKYNDAVSCLKMATWKKNIHNYWAKPVQHGQVATPSYWSQGLVNNKYKLAKLARSYLCVPTRSWLEESRFWVVHLSIHYLTISQNCFEGFILFIYLFFIWNELGAWMNLDQRKKLLDFGGQRSTSLWPHISPVLMNAISQERFPSNLAQLLT